MARTALRVGNKKNQHDQKKGWPGFPYGVRFHSVLLSGTAKGGWPWRGSVKIEPGFFQVF